MIYLPRAVLIAAAMATLPLAAPTAHAESPVAAAIRVEIAYSHKAGDPERAFYEARGNAPFWLTDQGEATPAARALVAWAGQADANALPAGRYDVAPLAAELAKPGPRPAFRTAALDETLTRLYLDYGRDMSSGIVAPKDISDEIDVQPVRADAADLLQKLAQAPDVGVLLDSLLPADPGYRRLLALYAGMKSVVAAGGWGPVVADGPTLREGDRDPRVAQLRARLVAMGDLVDRDSTRAASEKLASNDTLNDAGKGASVVAAAAAITDPQRYDAAVTRAVQRFQARHGLNTDGVAGRNTLDALNTTAAARLRQVAADLERMRWFDINRNGRSVVINIADFSMRLLDNGEPQFETRAVVGKAPDHQTPEFNDELQYIVVNPVWNVPYSIASKEILPQLRKNPDYLAENNMVLVGSSMPADEIDWNAVSQRDFPGQLKQLSGPDNALGYVKFLFPNSHSIYMHDTPSRKLFAHDLRDYSHGCVRLQRPYDFAYLLLSLQPGVTDPVARFEELRSRPGEHWVGLAQPIPVFLTYRTAWVDESGVTQFRKDIYGRDAAIAAALAAAGVRFQG